MIGILLLVLLLVLLFGSLGMTVSPWFFIVLVTVLVLTGGGYGYRGRW